MLARLQKVDEGVQPICAALTGVRGRFRTYGPRLAAARARVEAGEMEWLTKPLIDELRPAALQLSPALYDQERNRVAARFEEAVQLAEQGRSRAVADLFERRQSAALLR